MSSASEALRRMGKEKLALSTERRQMVFDWLDSVTDPKLIEVHCARSRTDLPRQINSKWSVAYSLGAALRNPRIKKRGPPGLPSMAKKQVRHKTLSPSTSHTPRGFGVFRQLYSRRPSPLLCPSPQTATAVSATTNCRRHSSICPGLSLTPHYQPQHHPHHSPQRPRASPMLHRHRRRIR